MGANVLNLIWSKRKGTSADGKVCGVVVADDSMRASQSPPNLIEDRIGEMSATLLELGARTTHELGRGNLEQVLVKGSNGYVLVTQAGNDAVVTLVDNLAHIYRA